MLASVYLGVGVQVVVVAAVAAAGLVAILGGAVSSGRCGSSNRVIIA